MRTKFDERRLKAMALAKWRIGPAEWLVKVVPRRANGAAVVTGYVTQLKLVARRTREEMERTRGLRRSGVRPGKERCCVVGHGRLTPNGRSSRFGAGTRGCLHGGERYDGHGA